MERRDFLRAMLGVAMAPAVVKAENIMKIWVPEQEIEVPVMTVYDNFGGGDFTAESWVMPAMAGVWSHVALVRQAGEIKKYLNGELVKDFPKEMQVGIAPPSPKMLDVQPFNGYIQDLRITKAVRELRTPRPDVNLGYELDMHKGLSVFVPKG